MSLHVEPLQTLIKALRACSFGQRVKIMVGGHIFNAYPQLWKEVGADGYSANAEQALEIASQLIAAPPSSR
jgi:methanogenic corrinoid protein MtbC1